MHKIFVYFLWFHTLHQTLLFLFYATILYFLFQYFSLQISELIFQREYFALQTFAMFFQSYILFLQGGNFFVFLGKLGQTLG